MSANGAVAVILGPASVIHVILARRSIRLIRAGDNEWRQRWRGLDPDRRRSIRQRMKRGEPVLDREDAELALRADAQIDHVRGAIAPIALASQLLVVGFLVVGVVSGSVIFIIIGASGLGSGAVIDVLSRRQRRRSHTSAAATRRLHAM